MSHYGRDLQESNTYCLLTVTCIFKTPNWITRSERSLMALNNKLLAKPQSLLAVCLQETYIC